MVVPPNLHTLPLRMCLGCWVNVWVLPMPLVMAFFRKFVTLTQVTLAQEDISWIKELLLETDSHLGAFNRGAPGALDHHVSVSTGVFFGPQVWESRGGFVEHKRPGLHSRPTATCMLIKRFWWFLFILKFETDSPKPFLRRKPRLMSLSTVSATYG